MWIVFGAMPIFPLDGCIQYFIIIGAGHLVGEQGLINLLKKKGYKLT